MIDFCMEPGQVPVEHRLHYPLNDLDVKRLLPDETPDPAQRAEAWQACWDTLGRAVLRYIQGKNQTSTDDRDILADALATAYIEVEHRRYEYRPGVPFTAYVKGIARNLILEAYRRDKRSVPLTEDFDRVDHFDFEAAVEHAEERDTVHRHLSELSPRRQTILLLHCAGHDTAHIASSLGIRKELVRQEKRRGIQQLKRKLG